MVLERRDIVILCKIVCLVSNLDQIRIGSRQKLKIEYKLKNVGNPIHYINVQTHTHNLGFIISMMKSFFEHYLIIGERRGGFIIFPKVYARN